MKSCELDPIPMHIVKDNLDIFLPVLTKLVNLSLIEGVYCDEWKAAILKPLLKKLGIDLIVKNDPPVNNVPFLSKLVGSAAIQQLNHHCK